MITIRNDPVSGHHWPVPGPGPGVTMTVSGHHTLSHVQMEEHQSSINLFLYSLTHQLMITGWTIGFYFVDFWIYLSFKYSTDWFVLLQLKDHSFFIDVEVEDEWQSPNLENIWSFCSSNGPLHTRSGIRIWADLVPLYVWCRTWVIWVTKVVLYLTPSMSSNPSQWRPVKIFQNEWQKYLEGVYFVFISCNTICPASEVVQILRSITTFRFSMKTFQPIQQHQQCTDSNI